MKIMGSGLVLQAAVFALLGLGLGCGSDDPEPAPPGVDMNTEDTGGTNNPEEDMGVPDQGTEDMSEADMPEADMPETDMNGEDMEPDMMTGPTVVPVPNGNFESPILVPGEELQPTNFFARSLFGVGGISVMEAPSEFPSLSGQVMALNAAVNTYVEIVSDDIETLEAGTEYEVSVKWAAEASGSTRYAGISLFAGEDTFNMRHIALDSIALPEANAEGVMTVSVVVPQVYDGERLRVVISVMNDSAATRVFFDDITLTKTESTIPDGVFNADFDSLNIPKGYYVNNLPGQFADFDYCNFVGVVNHTTTPLPEGADTGENAGELGGASCRVLVPLYNVNSTHVRVSSKYNRRADFNAPDTFELLLVDGLSTAIPAFISYTEEDIIARSTATFDAGGDSWRDISICGEVGEEPQVIFEFQSAANARMLFDSIVVEPLSSCP